MKIKKIILLNLILMVGSSQANWWNSLMGTISSYGYESEDSDFGFYIKTTASAVVLAGTTIYCYKTMQERKALAQQVKVAKQLNLAAQVQRDELLCKKIREQVHLKRLSDQQNALNGTRMRQKFTELYTQAYADGDDIADQETAKAFSGALQPIVISEQLAELQAKEDASL